MTVAKVTPGWAVELIGEEFDLDDLREMLHRRVSGCPWVEDYSQLDGLKLLLRSPGWDHLDEARDVSSDANRIVEMLNGAGPLLVDENARPISIGQIMKFKPDGSRDKVPVVITASATISGARARGTVTVSGPAPIPPKETSLQKWLIAAEEEDTRAELLVHLSRADNWFDIYKAIELAETLLGGEQAAKVAAGSDWKRIKQEANVHRHAPGRCEPPKMRPTFQEARLFVLRSLRRIL